MKIEVDIYKEIRMGALRGESQRSIAKRLGISRPTVKKYYDGSSHRCLSIKLSHLIKINYEFLTRFVIDMEPLPTRF